MAGRTLLGLAAIAMGAFPPAARSQEPTQEERLRRLEEAFRRQGERAALAAGYDGGFFVASADGESRFTVEGLLQVHGNFFERGLAERESEFFLRRMRFEFGGEIQRRYLFHVEPKFTEEEVDLEEAWIGADLGAEGPRGMLGRMKEPFSLEEMIPLKHIDFVNLSILNQLVPAEEHGATFLGETFDDRLEYGAAFFTGNGTDDFNADRGAASRLVARPGAGLQVGGAATIGRATQGVGGEEMKTETRVAFLEFEPGSSLDGTRVRFGAEAAWLVGPLAVSAEAMRIEQEMEGPGGEADVSLSGGYGALSWVITGEEKTFRGVRPQRPLRIEEGLRGGPGALQFAARVSTLSLDDDLASAGLVAQGSLPRRVRSYDLGFNWYATWHARVKVHLVRTDYGRAIAFEGETRRSEDALVLQFQLHF